MMTQQECHVKSNEEHGNNGKPEEKFNNEEDQGKSCPKLPSISKIEIKNVNNDDEDDKMYETGTNEKFSNSYFIHATDDEIFGKVEPGNSNIPGLDIFFDNKFTKVSHMRTNQESENFLVLVKEDLMGNFAFGMLAKADKKEPASKKTTLAPITEKAAAKEESASEEDSSDEREEKQAEA